MKIRNTTKEVQQNPLYGAILGLDNGRGILEQEARGQAQFVFSSQLPAEMRPNRETFEKMGIRFGEPDPQDLLFLPAELPAGWSKKATGQSMHSKVLDERGRERISIFYKAAFYDRSADMSAVRRFSIRTNYCNAAGESCYSEDGERRLFEPTHQRHTVTDSGSVVFATDPIPKFSDYQNRPAYEKHKAAEKAAEKACEEWLESRYPNWRDVLAYWSEE